MTVVLSIALVLAAIAVVLLLRRAVEQRERISALGADLERLQQACSTLAPSGVMERVFAEGPDRLAEHKVVTAMFVDLFGYTALSETLDPQALAKVLNGYFERVSDAITRHRGRVNTFLGDGVLAFFGALEPNPWQCDDAVHAALAVRATMAEYRAELEREGLPPLKVGIGIHRDTGLAGLIGSRERREYTVIGRTVNLAARLQALTREHDADILVTDAVREGLDPRFELRALPPQSIKGIAEPVATFAVVGLRTGATAARDARG
jgi:class 3 adenylate cyclase